MKNDPRQIIFTKYGTQATETTDLDKLAAIWKDCVDELLNAENDRNDPVTLRYIEAAQYRYHLYQKPV